MSSDSDGEEFFDAEDNGFSISGEHTTRASKSGRISTPASRECRFTPEKPSQDTTSENATSTSIPEEQPEEPWKPVNAPPVIIVEEDHKEAEKRVLELDKRRRRLEEVRRRMQSDDDDLPDASSLPSSQTSSVEGIYIINRNTGSAHLRANGDVDSQSTFSLGKVGQILSERDNISLQSQGMSSSVHVVAISTDHGDNSSCDGSINSTASVPVHAILTLNKGSSSSQQSAVLQIEPDVVASTKPMQERPAELMVPPPVPPRRKRKARAAPKRPIDPTYNADPIIPSPASTVESITKEFEYSLDLKSATRGQYVVKPQDDHIAKAEGAPIEELRKMITEAMAAHPEDFTEEGLSQQLNMMVRTRTDSGKQLTDLEILEQVTVLNLDTGERVPLSLAEERIPPCINPLSLHIMRLTSEYVSNSSLDKEKESDEDIGDTKSKTVPFQEVSESGSKKRKTKAQIKRLFNRTVEKTVSKIKSVADEIHHSRHNEETMESSEDEPVGDPRQSSIKFKSAGSHKGPYEFDNMKIVQDLSGQHSGPVWTMKFSYCGKLLATAGQDHFVRIWVLKDAYDYFNDMRQKYNAEAKISPTPSQESLASHHSMEESDRLGQAASESADDLKAPFVPKAFCTYTGHTADVLDVSWSKNYFILSSSMDKTVRLWHISRRECLCCFQHIDFVTAIAFHPRDDRYFLSGSLDGKLRLWNIPDKKVALWNEVDGQTKLITAASFCQNGKFAVVGSYDGRCIFYNTEQLKYYTQIHVRSTRGKNSKGRKISGIEPMPGEDKILVTSNDSRIRLYDLRDLSLSCKYKGYVNLSSQIRASFSHDGKYIVSGSENQIVYLWKTHYDYSKFTSARRDRNDYWEGVKAHNVVVTAAVFAPNPSLIFRQLENNERAAAAAASSQGLDDKSDTVSIGGASVCSANSAYTITNPIPPKQGYVLVTADFSGAIKVFVTSRSKIIGRTATSASLSGAGSATPLKHPVMSSSATDISSLTANSTGSIT